MLNRKRLLILSITTFLILIVASLQLDDSDFNDFANYDCQDEGTNSNANGDINIVSSNCRSGNRCMEIDYSPVGSEPNPLRIETILLLLPRYLILRSCTSFKERVVLISRRDAFSISLSCWVIFIGRSWCIDDFNI